jgi:hypothetical protein
MISVKSLEANMGGQGSGRRWHIGAKNTVENYRCLDINRWHHEKVLYEGNVFSCAWYQKEEKIAFILVAVKSDYVVLDYRYRSGKDAWKRESYRVYLSATDCNLGGQRRWFLCPATGCNRRVAKLYGGGIFACRHCYRLAYESQREKAYDRLARRANKIRRKLDWKPGILNDRGWHKPKGMHWETFSRLVAEHDRLVHASLIGIATDLKLPMADDEDCM